MQVVHQFGQFPGVVQVGLVVEFGRLLHPGQIGAGAEVAPAPAQQQKAQVGVGGHLVQCQDQFADHLRIEGVVLVFATEPEGGEAARVLEQF
ncbi:hypothetical protein D3C85_1245330 [compost metagenome]